MSWRAAEPDRWLPVGLGVGALALYAATLCPTVYVGDSGELSAAIAAGGVCHPPGYPLFSLLGRVALRVLPWGEPAWRIGCLVALCAALTVAALYALCRALGAGQGASAIVAAAFAVSRTFWDQTTRVEVYSLHTLLLALALMAALRYRRHGGWRTLAGGAVAVGLGAAHHLTLLLAIPGLLALARPRGRDAVALLAGVPCLALYGLLTLWARAEPPLNWGWTVDLPALWVHATGRAYHNFFALPGGENLAAASRVLWENLPGPLLVGAAAGGLLLTRRDRGIALGIGLIVAASVACNLVYDIEDIAPYYLGVVLMGHALAALALDRAPAPRVALALAALAPVALWAANRGLCDRHDRTLVRALAVAKLEHCDPGAVLLATGDSDNFSLYYAQSALGIRPDVLVISRDALRAERRDRDRDPSLWYSRGLLRRGVPVSLAPDGDTEDGALFRLLDGPLKGRPVYTTFLTLPHAPAGDRKRILDWMRGRVATPCGVVARLDPPESAPSAAEALRRNRALWAKTPWPARPGPFSPDEISPDYVERYWLVMREWYARQLDLVDPEEAARIRREMLAWSPDLALDVMRH